MTSPTVKSRFMLKKSNLFVAALICVLMLPYVTVAQSSDFGNWLIYIGSKKVNSKWNVHNEVQFRNYDAVGDLEQLLLRTGVGYNLSENNHNVLLGYGYINSENYVGDTSEKMARTFLLNAQNPRTLYNKRT